jgi:uncharacterized protein
MQHISQKLSGSIFQNSHRSNNISYLGIFGSYIRGEQKEDSDLDILAEFSKEPDLLEFIGLKQELSEMLGVEVDLVMKGALKPRIGKRILEEVVQV